MNSHGEVYDNLQRENEDQYHEDFNNKHDFSYLTIDQLKHRLHAMDVELDMHKHPKSFYLDIYRETMKDEAKRELIKEILDNDHKILNKKTKKGKECQNFTTNKRKRTDEEETANEDLHNLNINHINLKLAEFVENNKNGELSFDNKLQVKKINFFSKSPSNVITPLVKKNSKIYKDVDSPNCMDLKQLVQSNDYKQATAFNPLMRILDTDFSEIEKPSTPGAKSYNNPRESLKNDFSFRVIKFDDQLDNPEEIRKIPSKSPKLAICHASLGQSLNEVLRKDHPRAFSFALDNNSLEGNLIKTETTLNSNNLPKYLLILLGGSVVIYSVYLISGYIPVNNLPLIVKDIPIIPIFIFGVVITGALLMILYLLKANTESINRNNELIAENIFDNIRKNLIQKFNLGDTQPTIDQDDFVQEFCRSNNYQINYFNKNVLPLVKENMIADQNMDISEISFYEDGKIKTIWQLIIKDAEENFIF